MVCKTKAEWIDSFHTGGVTDECVSYGTTPYPLQFGGERGGTDECVPYEKKIINHRRDR
jgi:hypothetical protein